VILSKTRIEFLIESAQQQAIDVLLDQRLFVLDSERYDAFMQALDNPPAPGPILWSLLRRPGSGLTIGHPSRDAAKFPSQSSPSRFLK
jgi:uncharacterized protein (DUF1778 family)